MTMDFSVQAQDGEARTGCMSTPRGDIHTPAFMPVGTQGSVKSLTSGELQELGTEIILGNTYHLALRPGAERVRALGGLHQFMGWSLPILTDSGGFQIVSLDSLCRIEEAGVTFRSHLDGSLTELTPEESVAIQHKLGADIMMCLDHPIPQTKAINQLAMKARDSQYAALKESVERTTRWASRCQLAHQQWLEKGSLSATGALFGIVQGGIDMPLRQRSLEDLQALNFDGYAIGGMALGEPSDLRAEVVDAITPQLPFGKPRYLMGIGEPLDIVQAVSAGIDCMDCVIPTRNARNGTLYTHAGRINIKKACYREDDRPIEAQCQCFTCRHHSRAYLCHLFRSRELLGLRLNTIHNLFFYQQLMKQIREAITEQRFQQWQRAFKHSYLNENA